MVIKELSKNFSHILGEIHQEDIQAADLMARTLLASDELRVEVELELPGGGKIKGVVFKEGLIVTDDFIATSNEEDTIDQFLPRR